MQINHIDKERMLRTCTGKFNKVLLTAPVDYWACTKKKVLKRVNGMGPDTWYVNVIPGKIRNQIILLDVREAAYIHDYMYGVKHKGWSIEEHLAYKELADQLFIENLLDIINDNHDKELQNIYWFKAIQRWFINARYESRIKIAREYYGYIVLAGDDFFLANKNLSKGEIALFKGDNYDYKLL